MKIHKKKSYAGRWLLKTLEAGLILAVVFFALDTLNNNVTPIEDVDIAVDTAEFDLAPQIIEPQAALTAADHFYMGLEDQINGEYRDAIADYTRAISLDSNVAAAWLNRGVAHEQMGNQNLAHRDFLRWATRDNMSIIRTQSTLEDGDTMRLQMAANTVYEIPFYADAGQSLSISVKSLIEGDVDPIIVVVDGYGNPVASGDDILREDGSLINANSMIEDHLMAGGGCLGGHAYTLMVTHAGGDAFGMVELAFNLD